MKPAGSAKFSTGSLIVAWLVYDVVILLWLGIQHGPSVAIEAIWASQRFRVGVAWYVLAQTLIVAFGVVLIKLRRGKASRGLRILALILLHLGLAFVSAGLNLVCQGAVWKINGP
ncbi:MAG: hypothetical protein J0L73_22505 [Verrucomicrobia bacterium]|nr:hypothetical protein [Verrucomicrobiota bacterium]